MIALMCGFVFSGCDDSIDRSFIIDYTSDSSSSADNTVGLNRVDSDPDLLILAVDAVSITSGQIHSVVFDLTFDPSIFQYKSYEIGEFLEDGGAVSYMVSTESQDSGRLIIGISLLGAAHSVSGSGTFIYLQFEPLTFGSSSLSFDNATILDASGLGGNPLTGISWYGGFAQVSK